MKLSTTRKQPRRGRAVQLPKGGFEHPFQDSNWNLSASQGKEHPRTVSAGLPPPQRRYQVFVIALLDRRAADV